MPGEPVKVFPRNGVEDDLPVFEKIKAHGGYTNGEDKDEVKTSLPRKKLSLIPSILIFLRSALRLPENKETAIGPANPRLPAGMQVPARRIPSVTDAVPENNNRGKLNSLYHRTARIYQIIAATAPGALTASLLEVLHNDLDSILQRLTPLTDPQDIASLAIIDGLTVARNKLNFAIALFDIEEVDPLYRLVIRNKIIPRVRILLEGALQSWPATTFPHRKFTFEPFELSRTGNAHPEAVHKEASSPVKRGWIVRMLAALPGDRQTHAPFGQQSKSPSKDPSSSPVKNHPKPANDPPPKPPKNPKKDE